MQVSKHVHAIKIPFQVQVGPDRSVDRFVYMYAIYGATNVTLIDSGVVSSETKIFEYLDRTNRRPHQISTLILTHSHPDHIGAAEAIQRKTGCAVAAHGGESSWIEDVELQSRDRPVPGFHELVGGSVKVDRILNDGEILDLGDRLKLQILHTPGHSKGSISLLFQQDQVLFSGDALPLPGDIPIYEDALLSVGSIKKLQAIDGINIILSSWDEPKTGVTVYEVMDRGLHYLQNIHEAVLKASKQMESAEPMQLCERVLANLGLPQTIANPLIARTFQAHLEVKNQQDLIRNE
jgi:glyoxylase-like metal-dependent hydrolase (beta-lactamase superfamily II)